MANAYMLLPDDCSSGHPGTSYLFAIQVLPESWSRQPALFRATCIIQCQAHDAYRTASGITMSSAQATETACLRADATFSALGQR